MPFSHAVGETDGIKRSQSNKTQRNNIYIRSIDINMQSVGLKTKRRKTVVQFSSIKLKIKTNMQKTFRASWQKISPITHQQSEWEDQEIRKTFPNKNHNKYSSKWARNTWVKAEVHGSEIISTSKV